MTPKQVKDIFDKLPPKRRKVLVGFLAGHSREKIMIDADIPSDAALTGHLKELYKNFRINTGWNDADDRRSGARKLPLLISSFARCMPELISDRIAEVPERVEQEEVIANKPTVTNPLESDTAPKISIEANSFLEYFSKSIDQLKSKDLDVRIGAIYTLGTLAKYSSPSEHWTIMEYLAAFIRSNAPRKEEEEGKEDRSHKPDRFLKGSSPSIPDDIKVALTLIKERDLNKDKGVLNLSNTDLREAIFTGFNLEGVNFYKANLKGANLDGVNLEGANLDEANLQWAKLCNAKLQRATLRRANLGHASLNRAELQGAILDSASLEMAYLWYVNLQEARLCNTKLEGAILREANLEGAAFDGAVLKGAFLNGANMKEISLDVANLEGANLKDAKNLKLEQIKTAFRDSYTVLPDDINTRTLDAS